MLKRLIAPILIASLPFSAFSQTPNPDWSPTAKLSMEISLSAGMRWTRFFEKHPNYRDFKFGTYREIDVLRNLHEKTSIKSICFSNGACGLVAHDKDAMHGVKTLFIFSEQEIADTLQRESAPIIPGMAFVKVDYASYAALERQAYKYQLGDSDDVDEKLLMCGLAAVGCAISPWVGGPFGAALTCIATAVGCSYAIKALIKFQNQVNSGEIPIPEQPGGSHGGSSGPTIGPGHSTGGTAGAAGGITMKCVSGKVTIDDEKGFPEVKCYPI